MFSEKTTEKLLVPNVGEAIYIEQILPLASLMFTEKLLVPNVCH